jgi:exosome complex RNA-binding protein Rrp4
MEKSSGCTVVPGDVIGEYSVNLCLGCGTYLVENTIYASVAGFLLIDGNQISVLRTSNRKPGSSIVPATNCIVLAKVCSLCFVNYLDSEFHGFRDGMLLHTLF